MTPLVDIHCHLLAGLDDGPQSFDEAIAMCRIAWEEGVRSVAATAHMSECWPDVTGSLIRESTRQLSARLREIQLPLSVYPSAEIIVRPDLDAAWLRGELLGVSGRSAYVLIEFPPGAFFDLRDVIRRLRQVGLRPILAHPERTTGLLRDEGAVAALIREGCLLQASSESLTGPPLSETTQVLKRWTREGLVHFVGSDGHGSEHRVPRMAAAYEQVAHWAGRAVADRVCSLHGLAVLEGRALRVATPQPAKRPWYAFFR